MATNTNTIKTRVQLKSDTEANWNKAGPKDNSNGFVPLLGELIVYTADDAHPFSRLKMGDGHTNVTLLPFIDAGTINGEALHSLLEMYAARANFPSPGVENRLYIDLTTKDIYCYTNSGGYTLLSNITYTTEKASISTITSWNAGTMTSVTYNNDGSITVTNGSAPRLGYHSVLVVSNIKKEVN